MSVEPWDQKPFHVADESSGPVIRTILLDHCSHPSLWVGHCYLAPFELSPCLGFRLLKARGEAQEGGERGRLELLVGSRRTGEGGEAGGGNCGVVVERRGAKGVMRGRRGAWSVVADAIDVAGRPGGLKRAWSILSENKLEHLVVGFLVAGFLVLVLVARVLYWANLNSLQWNMLLTTAALILNIMLCSFHLVVIVNLWEYSKASLAATPSPPAGHLLPLYHAALRPSCLAIGPYVGGRETSCPQPAFDPERGEQTLLGHTHTPPNQEKTWLLKTL